MSMHPPPVPSVIAVVGPTGSGKTGLAIELARRLGTEIISADSMQFYRYMGIGTAAPTAAEQAAAKHHFVGFLDPDEEMAAGRFEPLARAVVRGLNEHGRPAIVAGGSGLYVSAVIDGIFDGPVGDAAIRTRLREEAERLGNEGLMARLQAIDPAYAASLTSENDLVRVVRALEVHEVTGRTFTELHAEHRARVAPLPAVQVALDWDRGALYDRINHRVDQMVAAGWVGEVRDLLSRGYGPQIARLKALGYREIAAHLRGEQSLDAALTATKMHHRRYAKRQLSWFRGDARVQWLPATLESTATTLADHAMDLVSAPGAANHAFGRLGPA